MDVDEGRNAMSNHKSPIAATQSNRGRVSGLREGMSAGQVVERKIGPLQNQEMASSKWTPKMVATRMAEAARTLRALRVKGLKPTGYGNSWPDIVYDPIETDGWDDAKVSRGPPTPDAITRMDESLNWLHWLEPDQKRLVWMHADGRPRKMIYASVGMSRMKAWRVWMASLMIIASMINAKKSASMGLNVRPNNGKDGVFLLEYQRIRNASEAYRLAFPEESAGLDRKALCERARRKLRSTQIVDIKSGYVADSRHLSTQIVDKTMDQSNKHGQPLHQ